MALPERFDLDWLDAGIRDLVVDINRIPNVHTMTTCQGHIWADTPMWPTKDGWMHFITDSNEYLLLAIDLFCREKGFFSFEGEQVQGKYTRFTVFGHYEPHTDGQGSPQYYYWPAEQQEAYLKRAEPRREEMLAGWKELDNLVRDYICYHLGEDLERMPYR